MSDWCPENDGAYRAELAAKARAMGEHTIPSQDALIRAALEVAVDAVCAEAHHLYNDDPKIQRAMLGAIDAIRYLKDDAKAIAAIKAKAEGKP